MQQYLDFPERRHGSYVIEHQDELLATCFASRRAEFSLAWGLLDYVCVRPNHRGKKLGFMVCASVLRYFRERSYRAVTLTTLPITSDNHQLPAIKTYLELGFLPVKTEENVSLGEQIYRELNWPLPVKWWEGVASFQSEIDQ